jgi:SAM-dependent methyltransferase
MKNCLVCDSQNVQEIIDLGMHSFADTFISESQVGDSEPIFPLVCQMCDDCGHVQLVHETKADERYNLYDYSYTSSNSKFSRNHWDSFEWEVSDRIKLKSGSKVLEIGSNDGYLTERFKIAGSEVLGVDPSHYMVKLAKERGIETEAYLFTKENSNEILKKFDKVDLVVANNVFNHSDNPLDFSKGVENVLKDDGYFVFEVPYWLYTVNTQRFDQIYHEHVSYFTIRSAQKLLSRAGLKIAFAEVVDYHGGSLRVFATKESSSNQVHKTSIDLLLESEEDSALFNIETYNEYMDDLLLKRGDFLKNILEIKQTGVPIVGVGAAAKANTFLNFYRLDKTLLDYVTDASEFKQGKYTPLTRIPIAGDEIFAQYDEVYALILSWNISGILKEKLREVNGKIKFLHP